MEHSRASAPRRLTPWPTALRGAVRPRSLLRSAAAGAVVGSTLLLVNSVLTASLPPGELTFQIAMTYLVPWLNATVGIALGLRSRAPEHFPDVLTSPELS